MQGMRRIPRNRNLRSEGRHGGSLRQDLWKRGLHRQMVCDRKWPWLGGNQGSEYHRHLGIDCVGTLRVTANKPGDAAANAEATQEAFALGQALCH